MTEPALEVAVRSLTVSWDGTERTGAGTLRVGGDGVEAAAGSASVRAPWSSLGGATWRAGSLTLHGARGGTIVARAGDGLDRAWMLIVARACPVPEFTRGLRRLGSPRGGHAAAQARVLAPLLEARRRLEEEPDLERRVAAFDATVLADRLGHAVAAIADDLYPSSPPDRRALEAQLADCVAPLHRVLEATGAAARAFHDAPDEARFSAWRTWLRAVHETFQAADRAWGSALAILPPPAPPRRRWWRWRGRPLAALAAVLLPALGLR